MKVLASHNKQRQQSQSLRPYRLGRMKKGYPARQAAWTTALGEIRVLRILPTLSNLDRFRPKNDAKREEIVYTPVV